MRSQLPLSAVLVLMIGTTSRADVILDWNDALLDAIKINNTPPPVASRAMAILNTSMFDAVNSIERRYEAYRISAQPPFGAQPLGAAAGAGHRALNALFPAQQAAFDQLLQNSLAQIPDLLAWTRDGSADFGASVADQILALRNSDNATLVVTYMPGTGPGEWQPTLPANAPALLPNWPYVTPWAMASGSQHRESGPPALTSARYTADFNEVMSLGSKSSATRTQDQTQIALFWADGADTRTPPGHWMAIARDIAIGRDHTLEENARLFALLSICLADAAICSWDNKFAFNDWRPITGIRNADLDGNPLTVADPAWEPRIATPPFPSYTSGHSTFSGAASKLLELFFGTDEISFSADSDALPGIIRSFTRLSDAGNEAGKSRIYGGIHWDYDNLDGLESGRELATFVYGDLLQPVPPTGLCGVGLVPFMAMTMIGGLIAPPIRRRLRR